MQTFVATEPRCVIVSDVRDQLVDICLIINTKEISITISPDKDYVLIHNCTTDFNDITLSTIEGINLEVTSSGMLVTTKK